MSIKLAAFVAALFCVLVGATPLFAHEGRDHGTAAPVVTQTPPRAEAASAGFELVVVPKGGELEIWLDRFDSNEPIVGASISVETPDGPVEASAKGKGVYRAPAPWATRPGHYDLIFTVSAGADMDVLATSLEIPASAPPPSPVGAVKVPPAFAALALLMGAAIPILLRNRRRLWVPALAVSLVLVFGAASLFAHEGHDHEAQALAPPGGDRSAVLPDGRIFLPKPSQRILAVRTGVSAAKDHRGAVELPGRIIPDPNASGLVQASTAGRLSSPPGGFPRLGAQVKKGDVLAYATIPFLAIDQPTLHQMAGDFEQQISILERRVARYEVLIKTQAVAQTALDDARLELEGLRKRRVAVDRSKREPEALLAPVDGVIASTNAVTGQIADPSVILFQIVDPRRLWVEAMAFDPKIFGASGAARTADGKTFDLDFVGAGLADRNQALPVDFAIRPDQVAGLRLGQFVTVSAQTTEHKTGIEAPRASVIRRSNGQNVIFEHVSAEIFLPREVRAEPLDGDRVLIVSGLEPGRRIVTQAAQLLDQVR